jgi:hypothetical protein
MLALPGSPEYATKLRAILCTGPSLVVFDRILRDAWDTLQGDLDAASRYRDILETICARRAGECCVDKDGAYVNIIDQIFEYAERTESWCPCKAPECEQPEKESCCPCKAPECEQPEKESCCPCKAPECEQPEKESCCPCRESIVSFLTEKSEIVASATKQ